MSAELFERCMAVGGVAVFPADTVYGLACDPTNRIAVERLYDLKRRSVSKPSAVMFFSLDVALDALPELGDRTREALHRLLPGGVSVLLPNPAGRFPLACGDDPSVLGLRVVDVPQLDGVRWPVLQSSANIAGGADPRRLDEVPELLRRAADLVIDGGELPGTPSTVVDLTRYERGGTDAVSVVRWGAVGEEAITLALDGQYHFNPETYAEMIREDFPGFDAFEDRLVAATGVDAKAILELGTGTGETARRLLARHPDASLVGIDESASMLAAARASLDGERVDLRVARLQDRLPDGPFDLVASVLCIHHLDPAEKADLFGRVRRVLAPDGSFVFADVVLPADGSAPAMPLTPGYDKPSTVADQLEWLQSAGFEARAIWEDAELAVIVAGPSAALGDLVLH